MHRVGRESFISTALLEEKPFHFETVIESAHLGLPERWDLAAGVRTAGSATLLDREAMRTIRVRGRISARALSDCDLCLTPVTHDFDEDFELYFYPMAMIDEGGEAAISRDETEIGFYEGDGVALPDIIREQLLLWFPVRILCSPGCKGLCQVCGGDRNVEPCSCQPSFEDPRWDVLRQLSLQS